MKYLIIVPDGAADNMEDWPSRKTPLAVADIKNINNLAQKGKVGSVKTIPNGVPPGSDAANLAVMGYDPETDLTGRSPLEAISMGIQMSPSDVSFRTNLVTLKGNGNYKDLIITDHSAGEITTEEAEELMKEIDLQLSTTNIKFYPGVSYRHIMVMDEGSTECSLTPPHDIVDKPVGNYLPQGENSQAITDMMVKSYEILKDHPINKKRIEKGLNPANSIWIWGEGRKPNLSSFSKKFGIDGAVVSAVDLIKGIGIGAGLEAPYIDGATGTIDTNYKGKVEATIEAFGQGKDFVYVHVEAPDECSHQGNTDAKIKALELIDAKVIDPLYSYLNGLGVDFKILVVPDHRTPISTRTHSSEPVPYVIFDSRVNSMEEENRFTEHSGSTGEFFESGSRLADHFFRE